MNSKTLIVAILSLSSLFLFLPAITPVYALCDEYDQTDSWSPRAGDSITISGDACAGSTPSHAVHCTITGSNLQIQSSSYTFFGLDKVQPNTGIRYDETFNNGSGVCPNASKSYGPFSGNQIPNCAYSEFSLTVTDTPTGETRTLYALAVGRTTGICPV